MLALAAGADRPHPQPLSHEERGAKSISASSPRWSHWRPKGGRRLVEVGLHHGEENAKALGAQVREAEYTLPVASPRRGRRELNPRVCMLPW